MENNTLQELAAAMDPQPVQVGEYTIKDLSGLITGKGTEAIRYRMEKMVEIKLLNRRKARGKDGLPCIAYSPADGKTWQDVIAYVNQ